MFDIAPTELLLVAVVALVVIGPKDLPRAMRFVGQWVAKARGVARHFRTGIDEMIRQSELEEMEKKWAAENERIMREHPAQAVIEHAPAEPAAAPKSASDHAADDALADYQQANVPSPVVEPVTAAEQPAPAVADKMPATTPRKAKAVADADMLPIAPAMDTLFPLDTPPVAKPARAKRKPKDATEA